MAPENLEDHVSAFVLALEQEREGLWEASWAVCRATQALRATPAENGAVRGSTAFRRAARDLFGAFASAGGCTATRVAQLCAVGAAFPEPGLVHRDKSHTWHRKVAQKAAALGRPVTELAHEAVVNGWGQRELDQLGRPASERTTVELAATCGDCGAEVRVRLRGAAEYRGMTLPCPVCFAGALERVPYGHHVAGLGRLG